MRDQPTSPLDSQAIAERAYARWEAEGRPEGRAETHWLEAEHEVRAEQEAPVDAAAPTPAEASASRGDLHLQSGAEITNTERALPPTQRRRVRAARHKSEAAPPAASAAIPAPHFVVTLDRAHLRIYRASETGGPSGAHLELEHAVDLPGGRESYTARESDQAGQFSSHESAMKHGSIDERLPMQREHNRRLADELAAQVDAFLRQHPRATWDFAAGPALHHVVLELIAPETRRRLGAAVSKDLVNQPLESWREMFTPRVGAAPQPSERMR